MLSAGARDCPDREPDDADEGRQTRSAPRPSKAGIGGGSAKPIDLIAGGDYLRVIGVSLAMAEGVTA